MGRANLALAVPGAKILKLPREGDVCVVVERIDGNQVACCIEDLDSTMMAVAREVVALESVGVDKGGDTARERFPPEVEL